MPETKSYVGREHTLAFKGSGNAEVTNLDVHAPGNQSSSGINGIEIQIIRDLSASQTPDRAVWRAYEIWTKNRIYGLDSALTCFEVFDRDEQTSRLNNSLLGFRLNGGRERKGAYVQFSFPFPLLNMEAMFVQARKHAYTSAVERVVFRVRELYVLIQDEKMAVQSLRDSSNIGLPRRR